jgi:hypothetical protein
MDNLGKWLVILGLGVAALGGLALLLQGAFGLRLFRLPGDVAIERDGFGFYVPIVTMLVLSALATLAFWLIGHFRR